MTTRHFRRLCTALALVPLLTGCAALDSAIEGRARSVNSASGDYSSVAILTNIVRAKNYEPLNFVSLTGYTGHDTFNSALPGFVLPPANPVSFAFGSSTASTVFSNDFNVSVLDDPGSYAALLEPINPALMGLFIKAGYPRELIYLLFFDYIRTPDKDVSVYKNLPEPSAEDNSDYRVRWHACPDPLDQTSQSSFDHKDESVFNKTVCKIEGLVRQGLTVEIDSDFQPTADVIPSYRFCFDPALPVPVPRYFNRNGFTKGGRFNYFDQIEKGKKSSPKCDAPKASNVQIRWTQPESGNPTVGISVDGGRSPVKQATVERKVRGSYTVLDSDGEVIEIHTRSVLGAYQYLGQILHDQFTGAELRYADTEDYTLLRPLPYNDGQCFASVTDDGITYCVPKSAANTKRIFSLLRQLTGLLTKPNNQPATSTVRNTPN